MKVKYRLSIGFPGAVKEQIVDFPDGELEEITESEKDELLNEDLLDWAWNYIEIDYEVVE